MLLPVVDEFHRAALRRAAPGDQRIRARAHAHFQAHFLPLRRQERAQRSEIALSFVAQQAQAKLRQPTGRAGVPRPAAPARVRRRAIHIARHHIGFHDIAARAFARLRVRIGHQRVEGAPGVLHLAQFRQGDPRPASRVRVLPAVFAHAGHVTGDIANGIRLAVERRREQAQNARVPVDQPLLHGLHGALAALALQPGEHRPTLRQRVDPLAAAHGVARVVVRAQIPAAIPGALFEHAVELFGKREQLAFAREAAKAARHHGKELREPHAFAAAARADPVHAVVPIAAAHQNQAVFARQARAANGAQAVFLQRFFLFGNLRLAIPILPPLGNFHVFEIGHALPQNVPVARVLHIGRRDIGQKQHIVRNARAHAQALRVPPVHHVAILKLVRRAEQNVLPGQFRLVQHGDQHILQLVAEPIGPARLIQPRPPPNASRERLIGQKPREHGVEGFVRRDDFQPRKPLLPGAANVR